MVAKKNQKAPSKNDVLTVGLGASAGGLDALKEFFSLLPQETDMAFIVIVHLSPDHESNLTELLQAQTSLAVVQIKEKIEIKAKHVYVIPPGKLLKVEDNYLMLSEPERKHGLATIDLFFRSLARAKAAQGACIILSGSGNDGTMGLKAMKEAGGLTMVQQPDDAQYSAMPRSAIDTGLVDLVRPVNEMAEELLNYQESLSKIQIADNGEKDQKSLEKIFNKVQSRTGHDFSNYKRSSVLRRIERRMQVNRMDRLSGYASFLDDHPQESSDLFKDLLISVTNFFRDEEAFKVLEKNIIPKLFEGKTGDDNLRVWVPGCATGEEAYSIAILLLEYARSVDAPPGIKVFASDIDETALDIARKGYYPKSISADVSSKRLHHHFDKAGPEYRIKKELRKIVLFASHDLLRDPPFSNQDLITCRNLLIYLNQELQQEVFNLFHYTLRPEGYLFLGLSDSNLQGTELFNPVKKKMGIYRCNSLNASNERLPKFPLRFTRERLTHAQSRQRYNHRKSNFETLHRNLLNTLYAPQSVIINENFEVLHATDNIQQYLQYSGGQPSLNILEMVKPEMRQPLRSLLFQAEKQDGTPLRKKIHVTSRLRRNQVEIIVHSINETDFSDGLMQVVFKEVKSSPKKYSGPKKNHEQGRAEHGENEMITSLEDELEYTKEQLQVSVEEYETSNEELRASNEELQSMNEELQSTTEELETSQEEMQSLNEELKTVNQQLESKVDKLDKANSDLKNLMEATEVGIVFVDNNFCVQRFTSNSIHIFNLIQSDIGRPIDHVTHTLRYDALTDDIKEVHDDLKEIKKVVHTEDGHWYIMRMRPYRSTEDKIEGVVLSFVEFTELREVREVAEDKPKQEALATLGIYALEQQDLEAIMKRAIDLSCIILNLDCAVIYALNEEHSTLEIGAQAGCATEAGPLDISEEWDIGYALSSDGPTVVASYEEEERFGISPFLKDEGVVSSLNITIRGSDKNFGLLGFYVREKHEFTTSEVQFVQVVANMVGMAIQNKYARMDLEKEVERSTTYQREILSSSVAERWELGAFLHDNLAQKLISLKMLMHEMEFNGDGTNDVRLLHKIIDESIEGIRDLTHEIIPIDIEEEGVEHAFRFLMHQIQKMHGVNCILKTDEAFKKIRNRELATNLYHVIQEAVKNAAVHGEAENICVSITRNKENLDFKIEDDGVGIRQDTKDKNGKGLRIMKHRIELLGGIFEVEGKSKSDEDTGTLVTCSIPLKYLKEPQ